MTEPNWGEANRRAKERHEQTLEAKVRGYNRVNTLANAYERALIEAYRPLIGKKILTHNGIAKRIKPSIPPAPDGLRCWRSNSTYSLYYECDVSEPVGDYGCVYCKASIYVGEVSGYDLTKVGEPQTRRTDYTVEEIRAKRQALRDARDKASAAQSELGPFGEYDL